MRTVQQEANDKERRALMDMAGLEIDMSMENSEHTSGPWKARARCVTNDGTQDEMAGLGWNIEGPPEPTRGQFSKAADAHLVAAAPDLLEALEEMTNEYYAVREGQGWHYELESITQSRAAIAKAKGEVNE